MKNIKTISVIFVFALICFATSGQLWGFTGNPGSFDIFFYALGMCFVVLQLFFGGARGWSGFTMPLAAAFSYMAGRLIIDGTDAFIQDRLLADLISLVLVVLITWISGLYSSVVKGFLKAADELILIQEKGKVRSFKSAQRDIQVELDRSRRHSHPFSVVVLEPDKASFDKARTIALTDVQKKILDKLVFGKLGNLFHEQLRGHDQILFEEKGGRFILVCPETTSQPVSSVISRLEKVAQDSLGVVFESGAATFPDESLTLEDLISKAGSSLTGSSINLDQLPDKPKQRSVAPPVKEVSA